MADVKTTKQPLDDDLLENVTGGGIFDRFFRKQGSKTVNYAVGTLCEKCHNGHLRHIAYNGEFEVLKCDFKLCGEQYFVTVGKS